MPIYAPVEMTEEEWAKLPDIERGMVQGKPRVLRFYPVENRKVFLPVVFVQEKQTEK